MRFTQITLAHEEGWGWGWGLKLDAGRILSWGEGGQGVEGGGLLSPETYYIG